MALEWIVDNEPSERYPIYTRANVGEVFPDVVMPFSWTMWGIPISEPGWQQALINLGAFEPHEFPDGKMSVIGVFGGYCYLNVSVSRIFGERTPGLSAADIDASFFGGHPDVPPYEAHDGDKSEANEQKMGATIGEILQTEALSELVDTRESLKKLRDARPDLSQLSDEDLVARARNIYADHFKELWTRHIEMTYRCQIPPGAISQICTAVGKPELIVPLLGGLGDVESAGPAGALWEMSRQVRSSESLTAMFDEGTAGLLERLEESDDADAKSFMTGFHQLIRDFGSRGPNEWEMASRTWEVAPHKPIAAIDRMRLQTDDQAPTAKRAQLTKAREEATQTVAGMLEGDAETQGTFLAAVRAAGLHLAGRERTKSNCAMMVHEARMAMYELGRRMVERGQLAQPHHWAFVTDDEMDGFVKDPASLADTIKERVAQAERLSSLVPPFILNGETIPSSSWARREDKSPSIAKKGDVVAGLPGCPGEATGRARVVLDPSEPGDLRPGDILIAPSTDPSWTPLFTAVDGVVVDVGATISHATIVSRELGVPCVISATDATRRIPDGAKVQVDGATGQVTVLEVPALEVPALETPA
jgi:rifampicin phosphotransferase